MLVLTQTDLKHSYIIEFFMKKKITLALTLQKMYHIETCEKEHLSTHMQTDLYNLLHTITDVHYHTITQTRQSTT